MSRKSKSSVAKTETMVQENPMKETVNEAPVTEAVTDTQAAVFESGTVAESTVSDVGEVVKTEPVVAPVVQVAPKVAGLALSAKTQELIEKIRATGNIAAINALEAVLKYMDDMVPGKTMPVETGAQNQAKLYRAIRAIVENSGEAFQLCFATLLRLFEEHKQGVFNEMYIFRFTENLTMNNTDQQAFRRIVNLLKIAAPVPGRAEALKQVSFTKSLQFGFSDAGKQRILNFFNM